MTTTFAAAKPRDSSARSAGSGAGDASRLEFYVRLAAGGGWRARGALARRAAAVDDARGKRESVGAAEGSALDLYVRGEGRAARRPGRRARAQVEHEARGRGRGEPCHWGDTRARGPLARQAATADAALEKSEIADEGRDSARDLGEVGGTAVRLVVYICGRRRLLGAGPRSRRNTSMG